MWRDLGWVCGLCFIIGVLLRTRSRPPAHLCGEYCDNLIQFATQKASTRFSGDNGYGHVLVDPQSPIAHDKPNHDVIQLGNAWLVSTCIESLSSSKLSPATSLCTNAKMRPVVFARITPAVRAPLFRPRAGFQPSGRGWGPTPRLSNSIRSSSSIQSGHIKLAEDEGIIYVNSECFSYQQLH